jgi:hypothetical protein
VDDLEKGLDEVVRKPVRSAKEGVRKAIKSISHGEGNSTHSIRLVWSSSSLWATLGGPLKPSSCQMDRSE